MRVKCSNCGAVIYDNSKNVKFFTIEREWVIKVNDENWQIEADREIVVMCNNCGHKIPYERFRQVVGDVG